MQENWNAMSLAELREEAKKRGLKGISGLRKQELVEQLTRRNPSNNNVPRNSLNRTSGNPQNRNSAGARPQTRETSTRPQSRENNNPNRQPARENGQARPMRRENMESRPQIRENYPGRRRNNPDYEVVTTEDLAGKDGNEMVFMDGWNTGTRSESMSLEEIRALDSGEVAYGILEVTENGFGFIRSANYLSGDDDVYVSHHQIRRFNLKTGDIIKGAIRVRTGAEKNAALLYITEINEEHPSHAIRRRNFEDLTPVFPDERIRLESAGGSVTMRILDLMSPIGKGQRGMIVSPPKAGKTTLMKEIARSVQRNHPEVHIIILLIDERPEEVTDIRESIEGDNVEVIYSTFDELPEHHRQVSEMVLGRAKRLVEHGRDVMILLDSITRLARAYNLSITPSGRTLSGGLDPAALHMPKKFFGAARNVREGGSLTILATALVDTGSRMDDVVFEEFKGTGNMEVVLDRKLSERRIFPAIDIQRSGTRREDLLLSSDEKEGIDVIRRGISGMKADDAVEQVLNLFARTRNNREFIEMAKKIRL